MLSAIGSPLIAGSVVPKDTTMKRVKVLRAFMFEGKAQPVGSVVNVSDSVFRDVIGSMKAEAVKDDPAPEQKPEAKKGKKDVG